MTHSVAEPQGPLTELSDTGLLSRARQGDEAAFELIVRRHNQALFRAARGILQDEEQAQEAVQDAYLSAFMRMDTFQGRASLKTWLTRIVINHALNIQRRQRQVVSLDEKIVFFQHNLSEEDEMASHITDKRTPEMAANRQEMNRFLETAIRRLPEIYRSVFMLRVVEGMSVTDCAYCLDISDAVVKKRLSRAREMLRKYLIQHLEGQESEVFEFAGNRCDVVTNFVMTELARRGLIQPSCT